MPTISARQIVFAMSPEHPPVLRVADGSCVRFETCDCFTDQIQSPGDTLGDLDWNRINPATGPLFVEASRSLQPRACLWAHTLPAIPQNPSVGCVRYARTRSLRNIRSNQTKGRLKVLFNFQTAFLYSIFLFIFLTLQSVHWPSRDKLGCLWRGHRRRGRGGRGWGLRRGGCCGG